MKTLLYSIPLLLELNVNAMQIPIAIPRLKIVHNNSDAYTQEDTIQMDVSNFYKLKQFLQKVPSIVHNIKQNMESAQRNGDDLGKQIKLAMNKQKDCESKLSCIYEYIETIIKNSDNEIIEKQKKLKEFENSLIQLSHGKVSTKLIQKSIVDIVQKKEEIIQSARNEYNKYDQQNEKLKEQVIALQKEKLNNDSMYNEYNDRYEYYNKMRDLCLQLTTFLKNKILLSLNKQQNATLDVARVDNEKYNIKCIEIADNLDMTTDRKEIENTFINKMITDAVNVLRESDENTINMIKEVITVSFLIYCQIQLNQETFYQNIIDILYDVFNLNKELHKDLHIINNYISFDDFKSKLGNINNNVLQYINSFYTSSIYEIIYAWNNLCTGNVLRIIPIDSNTIISLMRVRNSCRSPRRNTISARTSYALKENCNKRNSMPKMNSPFSPRNRERRNSLLDKLDETDIMSLRNNIAIEQKRRRNSNVVSEDITNVLLSMAQKSQQDNENSENAQCNENMQNQ